MSAASSSSTSRVFAVVQQIGRALMLPIAVLPIAALLLRLGQDDLLNIPFIAAAGGAVFDNLGILFAIGIAVGLAKENHGAAGLAGAVGYFITVEGMKTFLVIPPEITANPETAKMAAAAFKAGAASKVSVPVGIIVGLFAGGLYNRFKDIKLPEYLAFFGGRRFVPIVTGLVCLFLAVLFGYGFPWLEGGLRVLSVQIDQLGNIGLFLYGVFNRLLIVTGLHHIINNVAWFVIGDFNGATGDLKRFFAGDPTAGAFMAGFFPVMMFGLPAACFAMYSAALPARRPIVGGVLVSMALTSFLTGVTEPIEFAFMFLAPALYLIHAVLTGLSMVIMNMLDVKLGFGFSAGLFDYVINYGKATHPLYLIPVGLVYAVLYYGIFYAVITRFNLKTIGREDASSDESAADIPAVSGSDASMGARYLAALGGAANIREIDSCTTRLRLQLANSDTVDEAALKALGARGSMKLAGGAMQVIIGPEVEHVANAAKAAMAGSTKAAATADSIGARYLAALGGAGNIRNVDSCTTRLRLQVDDSNLLDEAKLKGLGAKGILKMSAETAQVVIGPEAERIADEIKAAMA